MRWFRKDDRPAAQATAIAEFWKWWSQVHVSVAEAISSGTAPNLAGEFAKRVDAIDPRLEWELSPGLSSQHALIVTPVGNPELRAVAARWLAAAPDSDPVWEYHAVRRAGPSVFTSHLAIGDAKLDMSETRYVIAVDKDRSQVDVTCYHPGFAGLPDNIRGQITFLTLDWLLGEDEVEIWLGEIAWTDAPAEGMRPPIDLRHAVTAIADDERWAILTAQGGDGLPHLAIANLPLRSARWPRFDMHVAVTLPYRVANEGQLPVDTSLQTLRDFEDEIAAAIGGDGTLVAHETHAKVRTLHFYVDSQSEAPQQVERHVPGWPEGPAKVVASYDPGLDGVRHLA